MPSLKFNLSAMVRGSRRRTVELRPIDPSPALEADLSVTLNTLTRSIVSWVRSEGIEVIAAERAAYQRELAAQDALTIVARDAIGDNIRAMLERLRDAAANLAQAAEERAGSAMLRAAGRHVNRWIGVVRVATRVDIGALVSEADVRELLSVRQEEFARLIRNVSEDVRNRIAQQTIRAVTEGRTNADIARSLQEIEGISRRRAERGTRRPS